MAARSQGVYRDQRGRWYFKVTVGKDPLTGRRVQLTRRGYATAAEATRARRDHLAKADAGTLTATPAGLTVDDLLDQYLDGLDADGRLAAKTRFDYRHYAAVYIRPLLGARKVREITPSVLVAWQRSLAKNGGAKSGKPLAPNTIRLARAPLAGAFRMAVSEGLVGVNPVMSTPRPPRRKSVPRHWTPEQAREFLGFQEGDPLYPVWAFLLGSGLRIGELVALRWENVDLEARVVRVVEFVATLGWEVVPSSGKSEDAVRTVDLDNGLVRILREQRKSQEKQRLASGTGGKDDHVFTTSKGGPWHPQTLSKTLAAFSKEAGLPRLTAHGLRHTSATLMLANGVPPKVAAERLGHADPTLFTNLYSHVTPTMQRDAADRIGAALFSE